MAKGRSLFGDPITEIQELTQVIKQDLAKLNSDIAALQQRVKAKSHSEGKHMRTHSTSVVVSLQVSYVMRRALIRMLTGPKEKQSLTFKVPQFQIVAYIH